MTRFACALYDTMDYILTCTQKLTSSQLSLPHGTKQQRVMKKLKQTRAQQLLRWATVATIGMGRKEGGCCASFADSWEPV